MATETIVLCYPVTESDVEKIDQAAGNDLVLVSSQNTVATDILKADIFCGHAKVPVDWDTVVANGKLRWIQSSAAGLDHCLVPAVIDSDIAVSGCSGLFANQVAEQTLALLFAMVRRLPTFLSAQKNKEFVRRPTDTLRNKTVSIIGFGGNGRRIAEVLKDVAGRILVTDQFHEFQIPEYVRSYQKNEMNLLFESADVVIITLPLTSTTSGSIGKSQFSLMKPGSYFINMARGSIVIQNDLIEAIQSGTIGYAGLDVVDPEPLPFDSKLWSFDNVIITPHVGAQSDDRVSLTSALFCENYRRFRGGQTLVNEVDKSLQFPRPENRLSVDRHGHVMLPAK